MNLTFPIADWFIGTIGLERGLVGHLFKGYDEAHIKPELKPIVARFPGSSTRKARVDGPVSTPGESQTLA